MLLRSPISNTKKFFQKTLQNFKSFFSQRYQKLPKTPPHNSVAAASVMDFDNNQSYKDLEKFYSDFTEQWDSEKEKARRGRGKKKAVLSSPTKQEKQVCNNESFISMKPKNANHEQMEKREECDNQNNKRSLTNQKGRHQDSSSNSMVGVSVREHRNCMVEKKLRELEMLDMSNVDYILDIEEVLHYYSRLTCPAYLEIVDKFFMEMYSEFFGPARHISITPPCVNSRPKLRSVRS